MSGFPSKVSVPSAVKERNNFPLDCVHQTTTDFGLTSIAYMQPIVPTDKVKLSISSFAYLQSLIAPNMGAADLVQRAFFVPYDFICADWKSFIAGKATNQDSTTVPALPMFSRQIITNLFLDIFSGAFGYQTTEFGALHSDDLLHWITNKDDMSSSDISAKLECSDLFDYWFSPSGGTPATGYDYVRYNVPFLESPATSYDIYFRFKPQGKVFYNLLIQCGYSVELGNLYSPVSDSENLLALFSVLKVYIDYYVDPRYNWVDFSTFFREFTNDSNGFGSLDHSDQTRLIYDILLLISYCWFGNDLFTSSWQSHESPAINGLFKSISLKVDNTINPSQPYTVEKNSSSSNDTNVYRSGNPFTSITDTMLKMLDAVSSYFKRNAIAGTRPIDILYARFGAHMPEIVAQRAQYLGSHRVPLKITDIMANAAGTDDFGNTSILGERAGQGIIAGKPFNISFESEYFYGYLVVLSHLVPRTMYYQGVKPWNLCQTQFDFFTPEMEDIGAEPIPNSVLYADQQIPNQTFENNFNRNGIFGYAPRYYQYKFGFDTLSGDFRLKRYYNSLRPYTMFRELTDPDNPQVFDLTNNAAFRQFGEKNQAVYDKMFVSQDIIDNHFVVNYLISANGNRPMRGIGVSLLGRIEGGKNSVGLRPNGKYL